MLTVILSIYTEQNKKLLKMPEFEGLLNSIRLSMTEQYTDFGENPSHLKMKNTQ